ncbi:putative bifunctional diguanylate cyclase/phosphodiesterase [Rhizosaccharibacter radicis]|uniref:EAL domain-containing protein n=1 Tax=Rhizosaccharibacter radicis TaxID=2782605 RepID=A0ABT1VWW9_9PROT|nr:EAL domain-containing protein [Acetobacteraceae bacterium KSS12]
MARSPSTPAASSAHERIALPGGDIRVDDGSDPFGALTRLALRASGAAVSVLLVEDGTGLRLRSAAGLLRGQLLPAHLLRAQLTRSRRSMIEIEDLLHDPDNAGAPEEERQEGWRAFAAATVRDADGVLVGLLCVLDLSARRHGREVLLTLVDLARTASALLIAQKAARPTVAATGNTSAARGISVLPGRDVLDQQLAADIASSFNGSTASPFALLRIDLDRLAAINDLYGRDTADRMLDQVAGRLRASTPTPGFLAHLGGSAFAIVASGRTGASDAENMARRILDRLREPMQIDSLELPLRAAIGVALFPADGGTGADLLQAAEAALAVAKRDGPGRHRRATPEILSAHAISAGMEQDLQVAVASGGFHLNWMPVIDTASEQVVSFEALIRWDRPGHGEVPPSSFIPVAEAAGLIEQVDGWVLDAACQEACTWERPLGVSVNVSPLWLTHNRLPSLIRRVLDRTGLDPDRLQVELSERTWMSDPDTLRRELAQVRAMGVHLALDDFGTGYGSLSALGTYPFDHVKLDRAFVRMLGHDQRADAIMRSVLQMVQALGMTACAEGVETEAQMAFLDAHGCEQVQGYLIGRPITDLKLRAGNAG